MPARHRGVALRDLRSARRRLEQRLEAQLVSIERNAPSGALDAEELAAIEETAKALDLVRRRTRARLSALPVLLVLLPAIAIGLLLRDVPETSVDIELTTKVAGLTTRGRSMLLGGTGRSLSVAWATVAGGRAAYIDTLHLEASSSETFLELLADADLPHSRVELQGLEVPAGTTLRLRHRPLPLGLRIEVRAADSALTAPRLIAQGPGNIRLDGFGGDRGPNRFESVTEVWGTDLQLNLLAESEAADPAAADVTPPRGCCPAASPRPRGQTVTEQLPVDAIWFHAAQDSQRISGILGGTIFFNDLAAKERPLRRYELVQMERVTGFVRSLESTPTGFKIGFSGAVSELGSHGISLMPSRLEVLGDNRRLTLYWVAFVYFAGLLLSIWNWWRNR